MSVTFTADPVSPSAPPPGVANGVPARTGPDALGEDLFALLLGDLTAAEAPADSAPPALPLPDVVPETPFMPSVTAGVRPRPKINEGPVVEPRETQESEDSAIALGWVGLDTLASLSPRPDTVFETPRDGSTIDGAPQRSESSTAASAAEGPAGIPVGDAATPPWAVPRLASGDVDAEDVHAANDVTASEVDARDASASPRFENNPTDDNLTSSRDGSPVVRTSDDPATRSSDDRADQMRTRMMAARHTDSESPGSAPSGPQVAPSRGHAGAHGAGAASSGGEPPVDSRPATLVTGPVVSTRPTSAGDTSGGDEPSSNGLQRDSSFTRASTPADNRVSADSHFSSTLSAQVEPVHSERPAAAATATQPPDSPDDGLQSQIVRAVKMRWQGGVGEAHIALRPHYLGTVTIALRVEEGAMTAVLHVHDPQVRQWVEGNEALLKQGLAEQGLTLERFIVSDGAEDEDRRGQSDSHPSQPRQQRQDRRSADSPGRPPFEIAA